MTADAVLNMAPPIALSSTLPPPAPPPPPANSAHDEVTSSKRSRHQSSRRLPSVIVGLNKAVYKYDKERSYTCPGMHGGKCVFTTVRSRFGEAHALIDVLKDGRKAGPLDFRAKPHQLKGVVISEQDKAKEHSSAFRANKYDFEIGYNKKTATVWRPFACNEINRKTNTTIAQVLLRGDPRQRTPSSQGLNAGVIAGGADAWPAQSGEVAAFVSNCVGWRLEFLRELRRHVRLDSFGGCAHNNDTCPKSGRRKCDKVVMAGAYKFVFAFENTEESHYVTEKVYTGLRSGAVPIYKGAPEILEHVPPGSVLLADKFGSAKALGEHLRRLLDDPQAYRDTYHAWDRSAFAASDVVAQCPWQCKVCEHVAGRMS